MTIWSILATDRDDRFCAIYDQPVFPYCLNPSQGESMAGLYHEEQIFRMTPLVSGIRVGHAIANALGYFMITGAFKLILEKYCNARIEYLPFILVNHKNRRHHEPCYIANVVGVVDCVDVGRTVGEPHGFFDDQYLGISKLHLLRDKLPRNCNLFRIASRPSVLIIRNDLRDVLENKGLIGIRFLSLGQEVDL